MKKRLVRSIPTIQSELSLCGPKDSFVESLDINIGLIKNRITSKNLKTYLRLAFFKYFSKVKRKN